MARDDMEQALVGGGGGAGGGAKTAGKSTFNINDLTTRRNEQM